jgi:hypothetical protein
MTTIIAKIATFILVDHNSPFCYTTGIVINKEPKMPKYIASNLPMDQLDTLRPKFRTLAKLQGKTCVVKFRGPRYDAQAAYCLKKDARYWAVYFY